MREVSFDFISEVENAIIVMERAESLLSLLAGEIDEIPRELTEENKWKVVFLTHRANIFDALNISALNMIMQSRKALEAQMDLLSKQKDPCATDQSTSQEPKNTLTTSE